MQLIAGVDEAGRGPLAGPVVVSAVILNPGSYHDFLNDSKKLTAKKRAELRSWIVENAIEIVIEIISVEDIDRLNILGATLMGMQRVVNNLSNIPKIALIDGNKLPTGLNVHSIAIVEGDSKYACIAAASIIAKETRDALMLDLDKQYPEYGFVTHKGYPTKQHIAMLKKYGATEVHRKSYKPVVAILNKGKVL
jgi:ribonuclease HII